MFIFNIVGCAVFNPNRSLDRLPIFLGCFHRLPIILGCFHRFLFIFRLLVGILPVLFSRRSPLRLQEQDRQYAQQPNKICTGSNDRFGLNVLQLFYYLVPTH